jgi:hypothetical protein
LYEQVEAQRMELEERDARIAEAAQIVKLARSAARQLAQKDAVIKDKDAEIARLSAKMMQFEQLAALMNAATQPSGAGAGASTKRTESGSSFANEAVISTRTAASTPALSTAISPGMQRKAAANETGNF